jgi:hypothetical protein
MRYGGGVVVVVMLLWMAAPAAATPVDTWAYLTSTSDGLSCTATYPVYNSSGVYTGEASKTTVVGLYEFTQVNNATHPLNAALDPTFDTFCIDLSQVVRTGGTINHWSEMRTLSLDGSDDGPWPGPSGAPMSLAQKARIMKLFSEYYSGLGTSHTNAAAFGAAVWEIVWDNTANSANFDVKSGLVKINMHDNNVAENLANTWLHGLDSYVLSGQPVLTALLDPTTQDQIMLISSSPPNVGGPVPEPLTLAVIMPGLGSAAGYIRRRMKK